MKYSTKGQVMNLTINPINSINNDKTSFKQKYIVTLPPAIQYQAKEVISKAGAASLAAAEIIISTFRDGKKSAMEVPAKPTLESLAKSLPEIKLFDGELLFDPNNLDKAIDFEKLYDKIEDKTSRQKEKQKTMGAMETKTQAQLLRIVLSLLHQLSYFPRPTYHVWLSPCSLSLSARKSPARPESYLPPMKHQSPPGLSLWRTIRSCPNWNPNPSSHSHTKLPPMPSSASSTLPL